MSYSILSSNLVIGQAPVPQFSFVTAAGGTLQIECLDSGIPNPSVDIDGEIRGDTFIFNNPVRDRVVSTNAFGKCFETNVRVSQFETFESRIDTIETDTQKWEEIFGTIAAAAPGIDAQDLVGLQEVTAQHTDDIANLDANVSNLQSNVSLLEANTVSQQNALQVLESFVQNGTSTKHIFVRTSGSDTNDGSSPSTALHSIKHACSIAQGGQTIVIEAGKYYEDNPIFVPPDTSIEGQDLRSTHIYPNNNQKHMFFVSNGVYITNLRILNLRRPAYGMSFPCSQVDCDLQNGSISRIIALHSATGYSSPPSILVESPPTGGTTATITCTLDTETSQIKEYIITNPGSGYTRRPHISIPPPSDQQVFITRSPYINNCTIITQGLFQNDGNIIYNGTVVYPIDLEAQNVDQQGAGGALMVDGNIVHPQSPLKSMLGGVYTAICHGGIVHWCINQGFAQLVSCYTHFPYIGFLCSSGGQMSISNSVCDFGDYGLRSEGYWPIAISTLEVTSVSVSSIIGTLTNGRRPDVDSVLYDGTSWYRVTGSSIQGSTVTVTFSPSIPNVAPGESVNLYVSSRLYTGSFLFEFCGAGISWNALSVNGGVADPNKQVTSTVPGVCYHTSSDERGNMKVGSSFYVDQVSGTVSLVGNVNVTGIERLGPFVRGGIPRGVAIEEITSETSLIDSTGIVSDLAVSTSAAVQAYVDQQIEANAVSQQGLISELQANVSSLEGNSASQQTLIGVLQGNVATLEGNVSSLEGNSASQQTLIGVLQGNVATLEGNVSSLEGNSASQQTLIGVLQGNVATLEGNVSSLEGNSASQQILLGDLQANVANTIHVVDTGSAYFEPLVTEPVTASAGYVYFDDTLKKLRCYDGTVWANLF